MRRFLMLGCMMLFVACGREGAVTPSSDPEAVPSGVGNVRTHGLLLLPPPDPGVCLVIIDEDGIDNDMLTIEEAAYSHGVEPDYLINDDRPTEIGNPPFRWNELFPGDIVKLPTGQVDDEGWFALPEMIRYADERSTNLTDQEWFEAYAAGTLPQDQLDKVRDVMPLRNHELVKLVGLTCTAVVYDSDISMNYKRIYANLQGARYGLFTFTVLAVEVPGSLPESKSDTSLYDLWVRVEEVKLPTFSFPVDIHDHEPDAIEITKAQYRKGKLRVFGESDFAPGNYSPNGYQDDAPGPAIMTVSVDGSDMGGDPNVAPFVLEGPMTFNASKGRYQFVLGAPGAGLKGRRVTISTNHGGAYNAFIE